MFQNYVTPIFDIFKKEKGDVTVISKNTKFTGELESVNVYIDGILNTTELESVNIVIGKTGIVLGNVTAKTVNITGTINGNITCESIVLHSGSNVTGNITYSVSLSIDDGAIFEGNISKQDISKNAGDESSKV